MWQCVNDGNLGIIAYDGVSYAVLVYSFWGYILFQVGIAYYCAVSILENKTKSKSIISIPNLMYRSSSIPSSPINPTPNLGMVYVIQFLSLVKLK